VTVSTVCCGLFVVVSSFFFFCFFPCGFFQRRAVVVIAVWCCRVCLVAPSLAASRGRPGGKKFLFGGERMERGCMREER
jgi:hypothetical protein